jgi:hypothetical protein
LKERKFQELYDEAQQRRERQEKVYSECLDKECTFQPHLVTRDSRLSKSVLQEFLTHNQEAPGDRTPPPAAGKGASLLISPIPGNTSSEHVINSGNTSLVFERLSQLAKPSDARKLPEVIDAKTGQPLFRPQTGRQPRGHHNRRATEDGTQKQSIGDFLYGQHR